MQQGRIIAFEGVDGAGKSTVMKLVAEHLEANGVDLCLPRAGKEHRSRPTTAIRRLTRDRANIDLRARSEMLLYAAREAQVLEEHVRPAIGRGQTVLLDRSMLTPVVLGSFGRGLELDTCEKVAAMASGGLEPDLTLIFDVHPRTSRIRKRLEKVRSGQSAVGGRKGLAGSGLKHRVRDGYLDLAARDGLPVLYAERATPREVADRVIGLLETGEMPHRSHTARPWWKVDPGLSFEDAVATLPEILQLYFTRRLRLGRRIRARLLEQEPALVAWALDLADPSYARVAELAPATVLGRFGTRADPSLRRVVADTDPALAARSLRWVAGEEADRLRRALSEVVPGPVVESLAGRTDSFAVEMRDRLWKHADAHERASSLRGCDDERAWRRRRKLLRDPASLLPHLRDLDPARVDPILRDYATMAPKLVLKALSGRTDDAAHEIRRDLIETGREVIDSVRGLDDERSWALREECVERWPSTVAWSTAGMRGKRTIDLVERCREAAPDDLFLKRRLVILDRLHSVPKPTATAIADAVALEC